MILVDFLSRELLYYSHTHTHTYIIVRLAIKEKIDIELRIYHKII